MSSKTTFKNLRSKLLALIDAMSISEKVIFGVFSALLLVSALSLLKGASDLFSIEVPLQGGTLREGVLGFPRSINPLLPVTDSGRDLATLIYSGLLKAGKDGTLSPDLAESYTVSDDGLTYTFILKDKIYFQDNTPVTAADVEFTVHRVTDPIIKSPLAANWDGVTVKAVDAKTVTFTLKKPYAPFIENLTLGILPSHIWKNVGSDAFLFSEFNVEPVGTGPYKIKEIRRNASGLPEYYHLVPFTKYAGGTAYISSIYIYFYTSEEDLVAAYKDGALDSVSSISPQNAESLDKTRGTAYQIALPRDYAVFFNQNQAKVLSEGVIRKALLLATPEDEIIKTVLLGFATPIQSPLPVSLSALPPRAITDGEGLEAAKALLTKNGWTIASSTGILTSKAPKNGVGTEVKFSLSVPDVPELKATATLLAEAWNKLGAKVDVRIFDSSDLEQNIIVPRQFDALLFGESIGRNVDLYPFWASSERNYPGLNIAGYANAKADKDLADARATTDQKTRIKLYQAFEKEIASDNPAIFLYSPDFIYILPKEIKGVSLEGITGSSERFANVSDWYIDTEHIWQIPFINK